MRQYELTYLISDNVSESDLNKVTGKVGGFITNLGGKVLKEEIWGRRKLAYPIVKQEFATYVTVNFQLPSEKASELERDIKLSSKIIRHLMIVTDYGAEELTLTQEDIAQTQAIEEVVGGEKSFEAVIGETEESKDLMAKREEVKEEPTQSEEKIEKEVKEEKKEKAEKKELPEKKVEKKATKKEAKKEDEADRLSKLDKELDDILGEDL